MLKMCLLTAENDLLFEHVGLPINKY